MIPAVPNAGHLALFKLIFQDPNSFGFAEMVEKTGQKLLA